MKNLKLVASSVVLRGDFLFSIVLFLTLALPAALAQAQTFTVLHTFTGGGDGGLPNAGVTADHAGNLYGTTQYGGSFAGGCAPLGCGAVYRLKHTPGGWVQSTLYAFHGQSEGRSPMSRVVFGPDGALYGATTPADSEHPGTIFRLTPPAQICRSVSCPWTLSVLYSFDSESCSAPDNVCTRGDLVFDTQGNIYGTLATGGDVHQGSVYELTHTAGGWEMTTLYSFPYENYEKPDAMYALSGVILDRDGNLWGTSWFGGGDGMDDLGPGGVFKLTHTNGAWSEAFVEYPGGGLGFGGLVADPQGNLYGATLAGGDGRCTNPAPYFPGCGTAYKVSPSMQPSLLYSFFTVAEWPDAGGPMAALTMDAAGNLYGTASGDTNTAGAVFRLSAGSWQYSSLHDFTGGSDGAVPVSNVTFDSQGNMYGTTSVGGQACSQYPPGCGVVWEITP